MKKLTPFLVIIAILLGSALACGQNSPGQVPQSPASDSQANTQATVDAAVAATAAAQTNLQATVDAAVAATAAAAPPTSTPGPTVEYVTMTEEELQALIDQSVAEASAATQQTSTAASQSASDDTLTQAEVDEVYAYYYDAYEALLYAEDLLAAYEDIYGELAEETLDLLQALEEDLAGMSGSLEAINTSLQEINASLQQGLTLAEETITQLETAAQDAQTKATEVQTQAQAWSVQAQTKRDERTQMVLDAKPENPPTDRISSVQSAFDYLDTIKLALEDNKLSGIELDAITKLGANASAGLQAFGGPQMEGFASMINTITGQLARGQVPIARQGIGDFELSLGKAGFTSRPGGKLKP